MKKILTVILALTLSLASLCACGKETVNDVSMYDLSRAMLSAVDFGEMTYVSSADASPEDLFGYLSDLDYEKVQSFFLSYATDGKGNADEVAVIQVKDSGDTDAALKSLQQHLQKRVSLYKTYDPTQSEKIEQGLVFAKGSFAVLIVSGDNAAVQDAFTKFIFADQTQE